MGLLSKIGAKVAPEKAAQDDALLLHGIMCMVYADGCMDESERSMVESFVNTIPDLRQRNFEQIWEDAGKISRKYDDIFEGVNALKELSTPELKRKSFVLAVDMAFASGDIDEDEDKMLDSLLRVLDIDEDFAKSCISVLASKYA